MRATIPSAVSLSEGQLVGEDDNRSLKYVGSVSEVKQNLTSFKMGDAKLKSMATPATKSVILRFGGQVSTFIRLDQNVYKRTTVLWKHLRNVDAVA